MTYLDCIAESKGVLITAPFQSELINYTNSVTIRPAPVALTYQKKPAAKLERDLRGKPRRIIELRDAKKGEKGPPPDGPAVIYRILDQEGDPLNKSQTGVKARPYYYEPKPVIRIGRGRLAVGETDYLEYPGKEPANPSKSELLDQIRFYIWEDGLLFNDSGQLDPLKAGTEANPNIFFLQHTWIGYIKGAEGGTKRKVIGPNTLRVWVDEYDDEGDNYKFVIRCSYEIVLHELEE